MHNIQHLWLDYSETMVFLNKDAHDRLRYEAYAEVTGQAIGPALIETYEKLYTEHSNSNAAVFVSLGKPLDFWSSRVNSIQPNILYRLADNAIPEILGKLNNILPVSIFSNIELHSVLPALGIGTEYFTHILSSKNLQNPKPALDGFYKIIELSELPAENILYVGDNVKKDVIPTKSVGLQAGLMWSESPEADYNFKNFEELQKLLTT